MSALSAVDQLRAFVRYKTHAGYRWALVFSDGALCCEPCAKANYRQIFRATKAQGAAPYNSDWQVIGLTNSGESEETEYCEQCSKLLWEETT